MFPGLISRPWRVLGVLLLLALAGAGFWLWHSARSSTPVSREEALAAFREQGGAAGTRRAQVPRPGVYTYRQSGTERGGAGPVGISRDLPGEARYVVTLTRDGYVGELDVSQEHVEGVRLRTTPAGLRAVWRRTKVTFIGFGRDDRRVLRPPPLHMPRDLTVGRRWSGRYTAGELPVSFRSEILRRERVEAAGGRLPAVVVRTIGDTGGAHPGTRTDTLWWSAALALPLRWTIDMRIEGTVTLRTRADLVLEDARPAT
jgi:hypothetical protein